MTTDLQRIDELERAIIEAEEPAEHVDLDDKLSIVSRIAKKLGVDKERQDRIAEARITNLCHLGDKLDDLREMGLIVEGRPPKTSTEGTSFSVQDHKKMVVLADELHGWPVEEQVKYKNEHTTSDTKELTVTGAYREAKNYRLDKMRREANLDIVVKHEDVTLFNAPFENVLPKLPKESVELVFTDPPYDEASIPLFGTLAELSEPIMPEGASLLTYFGHYSAPRILSLMTPHLKFWWLISINQTGPRRTLEGKNVWIHWKPMAWFVKGGRGNNELVDDAIFSRMPGKEQHKWEQHTDEFLYYIQRLTDVDQTVLDPMMGSGTTGIAALELGRKFIGIEKDPIKFAQASERIQEWIDNRGTKM